MDRSDFWFKKINERINIKIFLRIHNSRIVVVFGKQLLKIQLRCITPKQLEAMIIMIVQFRKNTGDL